MQPVLDGLFLLTILTVTFHKLQWELAGSLTLSDVLTSVFLVLFAWDRFERDDGRRAGEQEEAQQRQREHQRQRQREYEQA